MKLIFSRKGFDSGSGGVPSPIFLTGRICSLPIPSRQSPCYGEITFEDKTLGVIVNDLTHGKFSKKHGSHLDPDLRKDARPRKRGWKQIFGQVGASQTHLENQSVGIGDLFIFYGLFRFVHEEKGIWTYIKNANPMHVMFGWLQVGKIYYPSAGDWGRVPKWAAEHPHVADCYADNSNNCIYVASSNLMLQGRTTGLPGGGEFKHFHKELCLTEDGRLRSTWLLPKWFYPSDDRPPLSYHADRKRWRKIKGGVRLQSVFRGQEFVLDCDRYPEAVDWLAGLFKKCS